MRCQKGSNGEATSVDCDQTALSGSLLWIHTGYLGVSVYWGDHLCLLSAQIFRVNMVFLMLQSI